MKKPNELENRTLTIKKTLNAPVSVVWEAWTQADHIANWWGPKGMEVKVEKHDFRVGGEWRYTMQMPDGNQFITEGVYSEITLHKKIVTSANFRPMTEGVEMEILFEKEGDKTIFTFNVIHATVEYCKAQEKMGFYNGWGSTFKRLESYIEEIVG